MLRDRDYPSAMLRLQIACNKESERIIHQIGHDAYKNIFLSFAETIYNEKTASSKSPHKPTQQQAFFQRLFLDYWEICLAYETLSDFPVLSRSRPHRNSKLSPSRQLFFWRETYLNEFYIFQLRLETFVKHVARAYRKDYPGLVEINVKGVLKTLDETFFSPLIKLRGTHVHVHRSRRSDSELNRLELLEMLAIDGRVNAMSASYKSAVKRCQAQNIENFRVFISVAKNALTVVFRTFEGVLLDVDGKIVYPTNLKSK